MKIPLCLPNVGEEEFSAVREVLESGWLAHGPKTEEFEKNFAEYIGVKHAISVNSCASALQLSILSQNLKGEILLPSFTHMASANAIVVSGCKPVFVDVDYETCNINVEKLRESVTEKTVAIMPVHFAGLSCEMDKIMELAEEKGLAVIEDSAEAIGAEYSGKKTGSFGTGCFSFYPVKNMTTGEGGMITTNNSELAEKISVLRAHGISSTAFEREKQERPWIRAAILAGYNLRMCDVNSAIGLAQLKKLDEMNASRRQHADYMNKQLANEKLDLPVEVKKAKHVYQMYTVKLKDFDRGIFIKKLRESGVGASVHFDPPVHLQPHYETLGKVELPITERLSGNIVTLPMYPQLTQEQIDYVVSSVKVALGAV